MAASLPGPSARNECKPAADCNCPLLVVSISRFACVHMCSLRNEATELLALSCLGNIRIDEIVLS